VQVVSESAARAVLRVVDVRAAYDVERAGTVTHVPERPARTWLITLVRSGERWRIGDVVAARR
jgi:hypothetical protein